jgi:hypothetical protein
LPNQYTKAEAEGREKPKGANHFTTGKREKHDQATIDKIRAERAAQVAEDILDDPESSRDQKLTAAKVLLPYGKSTLQSIEARSTSYQGRSTPTMKCLMTRLGRWFAPSLPRIPGCWTSSGLALSQRRQLQQRQMP